MDVSALRPDNAGQSGVGGGKRLRSGERGGGGDAVGEADRGVLAVVAASADPAASIAVSGDTGTRAIPAWPSRVRSASTHFPDVLAWSAQGKDYAKQFSSQIATFLLAEVVVAQVFAIVADAVVGRQDRGVIRQGDIWDKVFAADRFP